MTETYRRKPENGAAVRVTTAPYSPPLDRLTFEQLREVARMADPEAEVQEVTFKTGSPVLLARYPYRWSRDEGEPLTVTDYAEVEPGECLAYSHASRNLFAVSASDLLDWYDREDHYREEEA